MRSSVALDTSAMNHLAIRKQPNAFLPSQPLILQAAKTGRPTVSKLGLCGAVCRPFAVLHVHQEMQGQPKLKYALDVFLPIWTSHKHY